MIKLLKIFSNVTKYHCLLVIMIDVYQYLFIIDEYSKMSFSVVFVNKSLFIFLFMFENNAIWESKFMELLICMIFCWSTYEENLETIVKECEIVKKKEMDDYEKITVSFL